MNISSGFWYTREICRDRSSAFFSPMGWSKRETVPLWGRSRPTIIFIRVDLPAPLDPMRATFSPWRMSRFSPSNTVRGSPFTER